MNKFEEGDIVKFKSPHSNNAQHFRKGLTNLKIKGVYGDTYAVFESDESNYWGVMEDELELQKISWRERFKNGKV